MIAQDVYNVPISLKKKVLKSLTDDDEKTSRSAGLARVIKIKIGARVMIRRNIDVSIGLVNGRIGTIVSVTRDNHNVVESIEIELKGGQKYMKELK